MLKPPQYLRHRGRNLGYTRINGKQKYSPGPWDSAESRAAYDKFVEEWRQEQDPRRTVADLALAHMNYAEATYRKHGQPTGEVNNIRSALRLLLRTHRHRPLRDISCLLLVDWRDSLIGQPDRRYKSQSRKISRQYISRCTKIVLRMLRWTRQRGRIEAYQLQDAIQIEMLKANQSAAP